MRLRMAGDQPEDDDRQGHPNSHRHPARTMIFPEFGCDNAQVYQDVAFWEPGRALVSTIVFARNGVMNNAAVLTDGTATVVAILDGSARRKDPRVACGIGQRRIAYGDDPADDHTPKKRFDGVKRREVHNSADQSRARDGAMGHIKSLPSEVLRPDLFGGRRLITGPGYQEELTPRHAKQRCSDDTACPG
jgi:hypothetical protein